MMVKVRTQLSNNKIIYNQNGEIPCPTQGIVNFWLQEWEKNSFIPVKIYNAMKYRSQDDAVEKAFKEFKDLDDLASILILCACLDKFYSTNVKHLYDLCSSIFKNRKKILNKIDNCDQSVVIEIANYLYNSKEIRYYSFASKFCFHLYTARVKTLKVKNPFYIYDSNVIEMLWYFRNEIVKYCSNTFHKYDLTWTHGKDRRDYTVFCEVYDGFKQYLAKGCSVKSITNRDCDKYLWLAGKVYFGY